jgi:hypothetical protein
LGAIGTRGPEYFAGGFPASNAAAKVAICAGFAIAASLRHAGYPYGRYTSLAHASLQGSAPAGQPTALVLTSSQYALLPI